MAMATKATSKAITKEDQVARGSRGLDLDSSKGEGLEDLTDNNFRARDLMAQGVLETGSMAPRARDSMAHKARGLMGPKDKDSVVHSSDLMDHRRKDLMVRKVRDLMVLKVRDLMVLKDRDLMVLKDKGSMVHRARGLMVLRARDLMDHKGNGLMRRKDKGLMVPEDKVQDLSVIKVQDLVALKINNNLSRKTIRVLHSFLEAKGHKAKRGCWERGLQDPEAHPLHQVPGYWEQHLLLQQRNRQQLKTHQRRRNPRWHL
jgi:hypothetical protein